MIIKCQHCSANLRVPENRGWLAVTCPKCGTKFQFNSGAKTAGASLVDPSPVRQTPPDPVQPTPPEPVRTPDSASVNYGERDELDDYRLGGRLRMELPDVEVTEDLNTLYKAIIASSAAVILENFTEFTDPNMQKLADALGYDSTEPKYQTVEFRASDQVINLTQGKIGQNYNDTYDHIMDLSDVKTENLTFDEGDLEDIRRMTLSHFVDLKPNARMVDGKIYEH